MTVSRGTTLLVHLLFVAIFFGASWLALWRTTPAGLRWYSGATFPVPELTALAMRDVAVALTALALLGLAPVWGLLWSFRQPGSPRLVGAEVARAALAVGGRGAGRPAHEVAPGDSPGPEPTTTY